MPDETLLRSQLKCLRCETVIASLHRHDFNYCPCGSVAIDGGRDYLRVLGHQQDFEACSVVVKGDWNKIQARTLLDTVKAVARASNGSFESWAYEALEESGLICDGEYVGPPLAQRDDA